MWQHPERGPKEIGPVDNLNDSRLFELPALTPSAPHPDNHAFPSLCTRCKQTKWSTEFHLNPNTHDGLSPHCKDCKRDHWFNHERWRMIWKLYALTKTAYLTMEDTQGGVCAICKEPCSRGVLSVDHDHTTGKVRGLLCRDCNSGLGSFRDNPAHLSAAIRYLQE